MRTVVALVTFLVAGCSGVDNGETQVRWLDSQTFVSEVQPVLAERCGNPSCHGRQDRPFAIYSQRNWRMDPARTFLAEPLSDEELAHNYNTSCVFVSEADMPAETLLLLKPLADWAGTSHGGGVIFDGTTDPDYELLLRWIQQGWTE